nr:hypothetical protein [Tanacetum cinerariifolium]
WCSYHAASSGMVHRAKDTTTYGYDFYNPTLYRLRAGSGTSRIAPINYELLLPTPLISGGQWESLSHELLLDIIKRVEAGGSSWPVRQDVVACAAVRRLWRDTMKLVVKTLNQCGLITFPIIGTGRSY